MVGRFAISGEKTDLFCFETVVDTRNLNYKEWLEYRKSGIGGSDAAVIFGVSRFRTKRDIFFEKTGLRNPNRDDNDNWVQKEYGKAVEPLVAKIFSAKTGYSVFEDTNMYRHKVHKFMNANIDFIVETPDGDLAILECKTCSSYTKKNWEKDKIPFEYELQVRHYMAVTGINKGYIACLYDNNESCFFIREVERDLEFEKVMIEEEKEFWNEFIVKKVEPHLIEDGELCMMSVRRYEYRLKNKDEIILSDDVFDFISEYTKLINMKAEIKKRLNELESKIKKCEANIILSMENHEKGILTYGNTEYSVFDKKSDRTGIDREKLKYYFPDVYEKVKTISKVNKFSIKTKKISAF